MGWFIYDCFSHRCGNLFGKIQPFGMEIIFPFFGGEERSLKVKLSHRSSKAAVLLHASPISRQSFNCDCYVKINEKGLLIDEPIPYIPLKRCVLSWQTASQLVMLMMSFMCV